MRKRLFLALAVAAIFSVDEADALASPLTAWVEFDKLVLDQCPTSHIAREPAGEINYLQEQFVSTLSPSQTQTFDRVIPRLGGGPKACANRDGITCPTAWNMVALKRAGLMSKLVTFSCSHNAPTR